MIILILLWSVNLSGNMNHSYIDAKSKEVSSPFLQTAREDNELCHDPKCTEVHKSQNEGHFQCFHL